MVITREKLDKTVEKAAALALECMIYNLGDDCFDNPLPYWGNKSMRDKLQSLPKASQNYCVALENLKECLSETTYELRKRLEHNA